MTRFTSSAVLTLVLIGSISSCATERSAIRSASSPTVPYYEAATPGPVEVEAKAPALSAANSTLLAASQTVVQGPLPRPMGVQQQHFMVLIGERQLEDPLWGNLDDQFDVGFTFDKRENNGPLALDVGFYFSGDSTTTLTGPGLGVLTDVYSDILEFNLGGLKMLSDKPTGLQPYLGGGLALTWTGATLYRFGSYIRDDDFSAGYYARAGLALQSATGSMIGIDFHYLGATSLNLGNRNVDIDGLIISIMFGMGF